MYYLKAAVVALCLTGAAAANDAARQLANYVDLDVSVAIDGSPFVQLRPGDVPKMNDIPCGGSKKIVFKISEGEDKVDDTDKDVLDMYMIDIDRDGDNALVDETTGVDFEDFDVSYTFGCSAASENAAADSCKLSSLSRDGVDIDIGGFLTDGDVREKSTEAKFAIRFRESASTGTSFLDDGVQESEVQLFEVGCKTDPVVDGDPHFKTWNNKWYDYMGEGDLTFVNAPYFSPDAAMRINIRTKARYDYSFVESAVLQIGEETLEVGSWGEYFLNGVEGARLPKPFAGYQVTREVVSEKITRFQVHIGEKEIIEFKTYKDWVSVALRSPDSMRYAGSEGMLGNYDKNGALIGRDGKTVFTDMEAYGQEWQVRADEPMLFHTARHPQAPEPCILPSTSETQRRLGEKFAYEAAEAACSKAGWSKGTIQMCIHDVMATGDLELAAAGAM